MNALSLWIEIPVALLLVLASLFTLCGAIGLLRMKDFFQRMHPPALASTIGAWCVALASILYFSGLKSEPVMHAWLIPILLSITVPCFASAWPAMMCRGKSAVAAPKEAAEMRHPVGAGLPAKTSRLQQAFGTLASRLAPFAGKPAPIRGCALVLAALLVSGCASVPSPESRNATANELARSHHWQAQQIDSQPFSLRAFRPEQFGDGSRLTIYLEGDGFAWVTASQPSTDPTPIDPVALRLALAQPRASPSKWSPASTEQSIPSNNRPTPRRCNWSATPGVPPSPCCWQPGATTSIASSPSPATSTTRPGPVSIAYNR